MKKLLLSLVAASIIYSCSDNKKQSTISTTEEKEIIKIDSTLITDSGWGPVTKTADIGSLKNIYGEANVKDETICGPECADSIDVTKIYSGTQNEFIVYWKDSLYHKTISFIETMLENAPYHTASNIKTGSTLNDLLKLNGKKINFSGFGWDYGGYIQSYNKGLLENSAVNFRLDLPETNENSLLGDTELNTDMPAVKKALDKIFVWQISLSFSKGE